jgi:hypothetical protein
MDLAKFNKELSYRVAKANGFENNNMLPEAISEWVAISEMVIAASKDPKLDFSFKSMLIKRTKGIIEHIKSLKLKLNPPRTHEEVLKKDISEEELQKEQTANRISSIHLDEGVSNEENSLSSKEAEIFEKSEFKNIPRGFKEIKPSEEFDIITPHDKEFVKEAITKEPDMSIFKIKESNTPKIEIEQPSNGKNIFCFACGAELPFNTKICPSCGTNLKI